MSLRQMYIGLLRPYTLVPGLNCAYELPAVLVFIVKNTTDHKLYAYFSLWYQHKLICAKVIS